MDSTIPVYKIHELDESGTKHIYIMGHFANDSIAQLWKSDPNNIAFDTLLGVDDKSAFQSQSVSFINIPIHIDDKIGIIKLKIAQALNLKVSSDEIYLYGLFKETLNPNHVYQMLTQNGNLALNKLRFSQFLLNLKNIANQSIDFNIENKEIYTFDDILKLNLPDKSYLLAKPLGQKLLFSKEYPFIVNPFQVKEYDPFLENSRKETTTLNNNLLLSTPNLANNTILLCLAPDVLTYIEKLGVAQNYTSKIYFPFLFNENIDTFKKLEKEKKTLIKNTKQQLSSSTLQSFKIIDDLYRINIKATPSPKFVKLEQGVKNFRIDVVPPFKMNLPIETIFKMINADSNFPLIKFNPSLKQENIYRMYSNNISTRGQKIPMLSKALIFKLIKAVGKESTISFYTEIALNNNNNNTIPIIIEIFKNATISVYNFQELAFYSNIEDLNTLISKAINPLIDKIKPLLQQGGYNLNYFTTIYDNNIEVKNLTFNLKYKISKLINIEQMATCFKTIFVVESANLTEGMKLRYKRVSQFNEYDSQQAFIIEKQNQDVSVEQIIKQLTENFADITREQATDIVLNIVNEQQVVRGSFKHKNIMIKQNPGFKTLVTYNSITNECEFSVDSINNILYIPLISIYIGSLMNISQDITNVGINDKNIQKLCSSKKTEDLKFTDLVAASEESVFNNEIPQIINETIVYPQVSAVPDLKQDNNMDELLDALGFDDYNEDDDLNENIDMAGGVNTSSPALLATAEEESKASSPALSE